MFHKRTFVSDIGNDFDIYFVGGLLGEDNTVQSFAYVICLKEHTSMSLSLGVQSNFKGDIFMTGNAALCSPVNLTVLQAQGATVQYSN